MPLNKAVGYVGAERKSKGKQEKDTKNAHGTTESRYREIRQKKKHRQFDDARIKVDIYFV